MEANITTPQISSLWYLGIDFGTTGISAALFNRNSGEIYPIYWELVGARPELDIPGINQEFTLSTKTVKTDFNSIERIYRLPSIVYLAQKLAVSDQEREEIIAEKPLLLENFKPSLKVTIPYISLKFKKQKLAEKSEESLIIAPNFSPATTHQPVLQWSEKHQVPLSLVKQGLVTLLMTFNPQGNFQNSISLIEKDTQTTVITNNYVCGAVGLEHEVFVSALAQLKSVIMGSLANWPEAYRFNLREAVLDAGLVKNVNQVVVIEDAIATALSELVSVTETTENYAISGYRKDAILIVNVGATTTELALVSLPENGQSLTSSNFHCHSFAYGGHALDQDIICQLLLEDDNVAVVTENQEDWDKSGQLWPRAGCPDLSIRYQLQQWLQSSSYRQELLVTARNLKVILPSEKEFTLSIGDRVRYLQEKDLEGKVLAPFVKQLNQELNNFLSKVGISPVGISRAICTGGSGCWEAIARWLRQKLPNAIIVQDGKVESENVDLGGKNEEGLDNCLSEMEDIRLTIGRVAYGLAILPLYPQIVDIGREQYNDYFLLWEILQVFSDYPLSVKEVFQLLEKRGINTRVCQEKIRDILGGKLPLGLIPSQEDLMLLSEVSQQNDDYQNLKRKALFDREIESNKYELNYEQAEHVREYLSKLIASSRQKLEEPLLKRI
ncbi:MAG: hypothetical protein F6K40_14700 [Okeania sp. SIO3I5]|uniref:hypothetical protein n=1 Tax=Okeania sp. SIO3I5 TaxID=2607805 RepID=UPI0013BBCE72|nr:hypothetical protein [Okeania sp. SIO3I5]NEQ37446.1 hypothetical protein [Okeania sp. SIO3I5]